MFTWRSSLLKKLAKVEDWKAENGSFLIFLWLAYPAIRRVSKFYLTINWHTWRETTLIIVHSICQTIWETKAILISGNRCKMCICQYLQRCCNLYFVVLSKFAYFLTHSVPLSPYFIMQVAPVLGWEVVCTRVTLKPC